MTVILEANNLTKSYGGVRVVDDLSVSLAEGEALGVVGPNGAGKTTMLNLLTGIVRPDAGSVVFAGEDISHAVPRRSAAIWASAAPTRSPSLSRA